MLRDERERSVRHYDDRGWRERDSRGFGDEWEDEAVPGRERPGGGIYGSSERGWAAGMRDRGGMGIGGVTRVPSYRGRGPKGYVRSDERLRELVCEALTEDEVVDASNVEVNVQDGEVTLSGYVEDRQMKRAAEESIERISGIKDVQNRLKVQRSRP